MKCRKPFASVRRRLAPSHQLEALEPRHFLAADVLEIPLVPVLDQFGGQIGSVQAYADAEETRITFGIYDTGASVVSFSAADQLLFELLDHPIPIKVAGGAEADAIGGSLVGDVSQPGDIVADGLHAITIDEGTLEAFIDFDHAAHVSGVQAFVGTTDGSQLLPTITGTPVHNPSPTHPSGSAALIDMDAYAFDFGELFPEVPEFEGLIVNLPDLAIVEPNTTMVVPSDGVTAPVRIPLEMWGVDNHLDPADDITASPNPVQTQVDLLHLGSSSLDRTLLFDTGAMLSVVSTEIAEDLGLDLDNPETTINVQGAAGSVDVPGYTIDSLELPRDDDGDGAIDGVLRFTSVPIYVLDLVPGIDGILGMNLFNLADQMLFDPFDSGGASLTVSFFTDLVRDLPSDDELAAADMLGDAFPAFAGAVGAGGIPTFQFDGGARWNNRFRPRDIDNSGEVVNADALTIVDLLRDTGGGGPLASLDLPLVEQGLYPDVNADNYLSNIDAFLVVSAVRNEQQNRAAARSAPASGFAPAALSIPIVATDPSAVAAAGDSPASDEGDDSHDEVDESLCAAEDALTHAWSAAETAIDHLLNRSSRFDELISHVEQAIDELHGMAGAHNLSGLCELFNSLGDERPLDVA